MAFSQEDASADERMIYAKPFPKSTTEEQVKEIFGIYGSIRRVKLRREAVTNSFRGSVYVEFADVAAARAAVASPPKLPLAALSPSTSGSSSTRIHVMPKAEYERKRAGSSRSGGAARDGGSGGGVGGGSSSARKRPRRHHSSEGPASSSQQALPLPPPPPPPPPPLPQPHPGDQHGGMTPVTLGEYHPPPQQPSGPSNHQYHHQQHHNHHQQQQPYQQPQPPQQQQHEQLHWRQLAEEREVTVRALEESLRKEKEDHQRLYQRLAEAQQRAQEAAAREATANQKVLARDVEIGSLKGEIAMLRTQGAAQLERQSVAHKARLSEMEASLQRLKDALLEKERGERELRKAAAVAATATRENGGGGGGGGMGRRSGAAGGADATRAGAAGATTLDDL